jgi:DNA invertase Pin-like site-specific DNA recombinase
MLRSFQRAGFRQQPPRDSWRVHEFYGISEHAEIPIAYNFARGKDMRASKGQAVSYLRVSGRGQIAGDGLPRQRAAVTQYAKLHGLDLVEEFRDEGVSGTRELEDRAGLAALMDRLESNGVRIVLVERADRLARDLLVGEVILGRFREIGANVIAAESGTELTAGDDGDPTRVLIRQVLGAVAQYDKAVTVAKLRAARDRIRRREGRCEGRPAYGTKPGEKQIVAIVHELHRKPRGAQRRSLEEISRELNDRGIPTRTGRPWKRGMVWKVLRAKA